MSEQPSFEMIAKTFQGLEEILAQELTELGADNIEIGRRMVSFTGDKTMLYKANFCLRTAIRILKPLKHFTAHDADEVYNEVKAIRWEDYLTTDKSFAVDAVVFSEEFRHSKFVSYRVKDAVVDYFREKTGKRPNVRINKPDVLLNIHIAESTCTLSLDSSGESLHRRGYRQEAVEAPLNEVLAAGMILMTGWRGAVRAPSPSKRPSSPATSRQASSVRNLPSRSGPTSTATSSTPSTTMTARNVSSLTRYTATTTTRKLTK